MKMKFGSFLSKQATMISKVVVGSALMGLMICPVQAAIRMVTDGSAPNVAAFTSQKPECWPGFESGEIIHKGYRIGYRYHPNCKRFFILANYGRAAAIFDRQSDEKVAIEKLVEVLKAQGAERVQQSGE